jgi:hypothetical protein
MTLFLGICRKKIYPFQELLHTVILSNLITICIFLQVSVLMLCILDKKTSFAENIRIKSVHKLFTFYLTFNNFRVNIGYVT